MDEKLLLQQVSEDVCNGDNCLMVITLSGSSTTGKDVN